MRRSDTLAAIIALVSAVVCYFEDQIFFGIEIDSDGNIIKQSNESNSVVTSLRLVLIALSFVLYTIKTSGLLWKFLTELTICAICTPPYFDYTFTGGALDGTYVYSYDAIISVIVFGKSYLVVRLYAQYSKWTSEKALKLCHKYKAKADLGFAFKAELKTRPFLALTVALAVTVVYMGFIMSIFERSYVADDGQNPLDFRDLTNSYWVTIITMLTVGFGDGYPSTHLGRFIGVIACILGMLLTSLILVALTTITEFIPEEAKSFFMLRRTNATNNAKEKAANVVKTLFRIRRAIKSNEGENKVVEKFIWLTKLKKNLAVFKDGARTANSYNLQVDELLKNLHQKLENDINDIKKEVVIIPQLESKCKTLEERQNRISNRIDDIMKYQNLVADFLLKKNQKGFAFNQR